MKKLLFLLSFVICLGFFSVTFAQEVKEVVFIADPWPPFNIGKTQIEEGIALEICKELFSRLSIRFSTRLYPWKRVLLYLKEGEGSMGKKVDFTFPIIKTTEREEYLVFSDAIISDRSVLLYNKKRKDGPIDWTGKIEDLKQYKFGIVYGYSYGKMFDNAFKNGILKTESNVTTEANFKKLLSQRIDIIKGSETVALYNINRIPGAKGKIISSKNAIEISYYRLGLSRKSPLVSLLPNINKVIHEMINDNTINNIIGK
jgi:polar amino acid transport system substrate-binding protein